MEICRERFQKKWSKTGVVLVSGSITRRSEGKGFRKNGLKQGWSFIRVVCHQGFHWISCAFFAVTLQKFFVTTMRGLERLQSKVRSPIFSFFSETLSGTAVVRAYGAQDRFIREFQRRFDLCMSVELDWGNCNR